MDIKDLIDSVRKEHEANKPKPCDALLSLRIPKEYKQRFDELQLSSKREFGKALRALTIKLIDSV